VEWADSRVALEVRARDRECLVRAWEVREVPCSREVECKEVEWVLVDLRSVYSFGPHCLVDSQQFEQVVVLTVCCLACVVTSALCRIFQLATNRSVNTLPVAVLTTVTPNC